MIYDTLIHIYKERNDYIEERMMRMKSIKRVILSIGMLLRFFNSIQLTLVPESHSLGRPIVTGDQFVAMETATTVLSAANICKLCAEVLAGQ